MLVESGNIKKKNHRDTENTKKNVIGGQTPALLL